MTESSSILQRHSPHNYDGCLCKFLTGHILVLEHVLSKDEKVRKWQHRLNKLNSKIACGCQLTKDTGERLISAGMIPEWQSYEYLKDTPRLGGYMLIGKYNCNP